MKVESISLELVELIAEKVGKLEQVRIQHNL